MRIGFIAMSGVRACDPELLRLGLTLPGFVERSKTIASLPSLGLLTLAGMTDPTRHERTYIEVDQVKDRTDWPEFDLVAISTFTAQAPEAYQVADIYRARGTKVVMGGLHVTALPDEALEHCDAAIVGEGEICWPDVLRDLEMGARGGAGGGARGGGGLKRIYRSQPREFDLADAPMPAFEMLNMERYNRITLQTTRGCPWRCSFCASSILLTPKYKIKPVDLVLAEVDRIRELWRRPFLEFADDNSFVNRAYWKALLPSLARRHVKWFTETDVSVGEDDHLLSLMREAGCAEVLIGLESPVSDGLANLELRRDWKLKKSPRYRELIANIQRHGIRVNGCFILGIDGQTPEIFDRVFDFARELELYDVQITLLTPFPGTPLYRNLLRDGRLPEEKPWHKCTLFDLVFEPKPMSREELVTGFRALTQRLYSEEATNWRRDNFNRKYLRPVRRAG